MRAVVIYNGTTYYPFEIKGDILRGNLNPWTAKITTGSREYSDFSQASLRDWHNLRGGLGLEAEVGTETGRLYWSEGVNTTIERGFILGPGVTTTDDSLYDFYDTSNQFSAVGLVNASTDMAGQSFTPETSHTITGIGFRLKRSGSPGTVTAEIYATTAGVPTGSALCSGTTNGDNFTTDAYGKWVTIDLGAGTALTADTTYAAILSAAGAGASNFFALLGDTTGTYARTGRVQFSSDSGTSWATNPYLLYDAYFKDFATGYNSFGADAVKILDWGTNTYAIADYQISAFDTTNSNWTSKDTTFTDPLDACIVQDKTDEYMVVTSATAAIYSTDGASFSELTGPMGYLAIAHNRLFSFYNNTLYYSPEGDIDGTWGSVQFTQDVGTPHQLVAGKSLTMDEPILYLFASRGAFTIDFFMQEMYPLEVSYPPHTNAGHCGTYWNSYVWAATGPGIKKITPSMASDIGPDQDDGLPNGFQGQVWNMQGAGGWLVYTVNGGITDKSSIFIRHGTIGGNHQVYTTSAVSHPLTALHVSPSSLWSRGRLWWAEGSQVKYVDFPDYNRVPTKITSYVYTTTSGKCVLPTCRPLPAIKKVAVEMNAVTYNCDANKYATIYYRVDDNCFTAVGSNWTTLGTFKDSILPTALTFPSTGGGLGEAWYLMQFAFDLRTNSSTATPEIESLMFTYYPFPERLRAWTFTVPVSQHSAEKIWDDLETLQNTATLLTFYPDGDTVKGDSFTAKITNLAIAQHYDMARRESSVEGVRVEVQEIFRG